MMLRRTGLLLAVLMLALSVGSLPAADIWAKGILHCHSTNSDGDVSPQEVADWYKDHGYQFVVLTDHEKVTDVAPLDKDPNDKFILIPGEELALNWRNLPIHANAIGLTKTLRSPGPLVTRGKSVANLVDYIRKTGAIPMVNHPSWYFALSHRELLQIEGPYLLEMANMGGDCFNEGDAAHLSLEQTWDILLSEGRTVYATATDDAHHYKEFTPTNINPGRGWVVVRVADLTLAAVLDALGNGRFYASTGVELAGYTFDGKTMKVKVVPKEGQTYRIRFVGKYGRILQETEGVSASYRVSGARERNDYVRCKVICSDRTVAWTQPAYSLPSPVAGL